MDARRLHEQRARMADGARMRAYQQAIERVCRGRVVCEIGAGLGSLSLLALRSGAARVFAVERDAELLALAELALARNGFGASRFVPIVGDSTQVVLPERADVILTGLLDRFGFSPRLQFALEDARLRLARPGAVFLPARLQRHVALARPRMFKTACEFWDADLFLQYGMDYGDVVDELRGLECGVRVRPDELAAGWVPLPEIALTDRASYAAVPRARLRVSKPGPVSGFCVAFEAELADGLRLGTVPGSASLGWQLGFCPLPETLACGEGDLVDLELSLPRGGSGGGPALRPRVHHVPAPRVDAFLESESESEAEELREVAAG